MKTDGHCCVSCYVDSRIGEVHLLFPSELEKHPSWADWSKLDQEALTNDARVVIEKAIDYSQKHGQARVWILRYLPNDASSALIEVANERLGLMKITEAPYVKGAIYEYRVLGKTS